MKKFPFGKSVSEAVRLGTFPIRASMQSEMGPAKSLREFAPTADFLDVLCTLDADAVTDLLSPDARLSVGGSVFLAGKAKINRALKRAIGCLMWLRCEPAATWSQDSVHVIDADLSCEHVDGSRTAFPATVVLRFRGRLISEIRLFVYDGAALAGFLS